MNSDQIGIALKGRRNGNGWLVCCPCPNHGKGRGDRFPSLSVADGDDGRLLLRCFAGCEFADILDELRNRGLMEGSQPRRVPQLRYPPKPSEPEPDPDALKIWGATFDAHDGIVREYLDRRSIALMPQFVSCQNDPPAMVVAVQRPDGKIVAGGGKDGVIKLFNTADGKELFKLTGHGGAVTGLAFSTDGTFLVSGSWDATLKRWVEQGIAPDKIAVIYPSIAPDFQPVDDATINFLIPLAMLE
jgi:hypothetical protein